MTIDFFLVCFSFSLQSFLMPVQLQMPNTHFASGQPVVEGEDKVSRLCSNQEPSTEARIVCMQKQSYVYNDSSESDCLSDSSASEIDPTDLEEACTQASELFGQDFDDMLKETSSVSLKSDAEFLMNCGLF
jgi:hypothetical protein